MKRLRRWLRSRRIPLHRPTVLGFVRAFAVMVLVFALMQSQAVAWYQTPGLNGIVSQLSGRKTHVRCLSKAESAKDPVVAWGASGYVAGWNDPTGRWHPGNHTTLAYGVCEALRGIAAGDASRFTVDQVVWAMLTITHEAGHLKGAPWSKNEAKTQCWAMKHVRSTWNMLNVNPSPELREFLWAWTVMQHISLPENYLDTPCAI